VFINTVNDRQNVELSLVVGTVATRAVAPDVARQVIEFDFDGESPPSTDRGLKMSSGRTPVVGRATGGSRRREESEEVIGLGVESSACSARARRRVGIRCR